MESLINIANLLYILTYFVQDLLRIRILTLVGSAMLVAYFSLQPEPVMALIYWNVFFILLNIFQLVRLVAQPKTGTNLFNRSKRQTGKRKYRQYPGGSMDCAARFPGSRGLRNSRRNSRDSIPILIDQTEPGIFTQSASATSTTTSLRKAK
jgi:hypothetical protein